MAERMTAERLAEFRGLSEQYRAERLPITAAILDFAVAEIDALRAELAERDAQITGLREALTPSAETKAAYIGEFGFWLVNRSVDVPWTTVKEIMAAILKRAESRSALAACEPGEKT